MGNIFSQCFQFKKTKSQGYRLGDSNNTPTIGSSTGERGRKTNGEHGSGRTTGGSGGVPSREDILAAAQRRQEEARSKGVQKGGGKLSKKLEDQQKNPNQPDLTPSDSNLQWRTD
ncbi:hypothetical protein RclHR1_02470014 [Rhizophagus clarus]|uniref:Uncharacterized protein n=1 Tax=Rhizophagus clarus TaxID=94130 RepID=A0A2Z6QYC5_9GLOM|nr:hypothetical protein RclHR1_02470014 [Rhizophagus clarus]GES75502.1 hypothetical protein GLOIN_2v160065 [Rhizophagus clarus]